MITKGSSHYHALTTKANITAQECNEAN